MSTLAPFTVISIDKGSTYKDTITLYDSPTNTPANLMGNVVSSSIKRSYYSRNVTASFVCTLLDASNGVIQMELGSANTSNMIGKYVFNVMAIDPSNNATKLLNGIVEIIP